MPMSSIAAVENLSEAKMLTRRSAVKRAPKEHSLPNMRLVGPEAGFGVASAGGCVLMVAQSARARKPLARSCKPGIESR